MPSICGPLPVSDFWHVLAVLSDVGSVSGEFGADELSEGCRFRTQSRHPLNNGFSQMEPIKLVEHDHVEWCRRRSLFLDPVTVQIVMVGSSLGPLVNQQGISVLGKDRKSVR